MDSVELLWLTSATLIRYEKEFEGVQDVFELQVCFFDFVSTSYSDTRV